MTQSQAFAPVTNPEQAAQILGVAMTADPAAIQTAFRAAARRVHPDTGGTAEQFAHVRSAYELLLWQQRQGQPAPQVVPVHVVRGAVVWVRQARPWPLVLALLQAGSLVAAALTFGGPVVAATALALATVLVVRALYLAVGAPPLSVAWWRARFEERRSVRKVEDWPTGPIPAMTEERIREYERTGR